jgi:hypothetical protein
MLETRGDAAVVKGQPREMLAMWGRIRRAGWFN